MGYGLRMRRASQVGRSLRWLGAVVLAAGCGDATSPENAATPSAISFDADALRAHVRTLAADSLCGREAGSPYEVQAATYIRDAFIAAGLEPGAAAGYLQPVPLGPRGAPVDQSPNPQCETTLTFASQNVLGVLPGAGRLRGQWVVLGAHYDHLGWHNRDGVVVVFNGADDNASGTALMMEIARLLRQWVAAHPAAAAERRSVMFQAYGAEEIGLVGSNRFVFQDPTIPIDSIVAMLNLDMVGRLRGSLIVGGSATSPTWPTVLAAAVPSNLPLTYDDGVLDRSDQYGFLLRGIPVLHLFTGLHQEYHTSLDDPPLLNVDGLRTVGRFAIGLLWEVATRAGPF